MEDALRETKGADARLSTDGLNPCSNGRCSARQQEPTQGATIQPVLILVLMEDALRAHRAKGARDRGT